MPWRCNVDCRRKDQEVEDRREGVVDEDRHEDEEVQGRYEDWDTYNAAKVLYWLSPWRQRIQGRLEEIEDVKCRREDEKPSFTLKMKCRRLPWRRRNLRRLEAIEVRSAVKMKKFKTAVKAKKPNHLTKVNEVKI